MDLINLNSIPSELKWKNPPLEWKVKQGATLSITAGKLTDLYNDPEGLPAVNNSPLLLFMPRGNFILSSKVKVSFSNIYDGGALILFRNPSCWAKLCFEFSYKTKPTIVSVVTKKFSDDCDSIQVEDSHVYLRISRIGRSFAFHISNNGRKWDFIRCFTLETSEDIPAGFSAQSPKGKSCKAVFSEISFMPEKLENVREAD